MKTLLDVIKTMNNNGFDFIGKECKTIEANGKRRTCLIFVRAFYDNKTNPKELLGKEFTCESYNHGRYYQVYRTL